MAKKSGRREERVVACAIDSQMVYPLAVMASSLSRNSTGPLRLVIGYLEGTLPAPDRADLGSILTDIGLEHEFLELEMDDRFISQGHISATTFAKFLLADRLTGAHLWIDADTVGQPGWDTIFDEIDQAPPPADLIVADRPASLSRGIGHDLAFNAGVLGWPNKKRKEWSDALSGFELVDTQEQALFNRLYAESTHTVSERYNVLTYSLEHLESAPAPFIIHYAGAHKPWHLPRRWTRKCRDYRCPWSAWFEAEDALLAAIVGQRETVLRLRSRALRSGSVRWRRDHSGLMLLRLLAGLGPFGAILVAPLSLLSRWVPRGTHPIHPLRRR